MLSALICVLLNRIGDRDDRGATAVEYALMVAFIAIAIVASVAGFGAALTAKFAGFVGAF